MSPRGQDLHFDVCFKGLSLKTVSLLKVDAFEHDADACPFYLGISMAWKSWATAGYSC